MMLVALITTVLQAVTEVYLQLQCKKYRHDPDGITLQVVGARRSLRAHFA